jgi:hypothetical protein
MLKRGNKGENEVESMEGWERSLDPLKNTLLDITLATRYGHLPHNVSHAFLLRVMMILKPN